MPKINLFLDLGQTVSIWMELSGLQPKGVGWHLTHSFAKEQMGVNMLKQG